MTTSSRCLSPAVCRWGLVAATSAAAAVMVVLVLVSTIDVSNATTGGWGLNRNSNRNRNLNSIGNNRSRNQSGDRKGWNIETAIRGGSTTIVQQQQQSTPPPPPPPRPVGLRDDESRKHHYHHENPHRLQPSEERTPQHRYPTSPGEYHPSNSGSTTGAEQDTLSSVLPKKIDLKQMTEALLCTSETNEKLFQGVNHWGRHKSSQLVTPASSLPHGGNQQQYIEDHHYKDYQNQYGVYGTVPVNVHPSRAWEPSIRAFSGRNFEDEELTLFHAKVPRSRSPPGEADESESGGAESSEQAHTGLSDGEAEPKEGGALYWGPDLLPYLEHILYELLGVDKEGSEIILVLAMIYLDRACSIETPRTAHYQRNGVGGGVAVPPCPFCAPRTVHRLSLSALVIAVKALRRTASAASMVSSSSSSLSSSQQPHIDSDAFVLEKLSGSLGIPLLQLQQMVEWMLLSLGDDGLYVSMEELRAWSRSWESFFSLQE